MRASGKEANNLVLSLIFNDPDTYTSLRHSAMFYTLNIEFLKPGSTVQRNTRKNCVLFARDPMQLILPGVHYHGNS